ncbi:hypothetical protein CAPTEDRAFT_217061 [Capitella teleta]|uniref:Inositol monophosphatase n=1 Tax=Capitella teleta TaxID=283909 RepID=R7UAV0_CAPTE|nr:hypothetical protein CAPTEDRAFT_217061 [Capitella teleta]|eukprot:ELU03465.1 hypothetical protein CAPTEDRAFT_217061 [Capitella teleta]
MSSNEVDEFFKAADEVARKACEMIAVAVTEDKQVEMKCSMADLVTETDQMVEKMIISTLKEHFPTHCFIGEESVAAGEKCVLTDAPTWVIDPVDGTNNFVHT